MTQPRKEQIKDLTTQFTSTSGFGLFHLAKNKSQDVISDSLFYTLGPSVTQTPGGAEVSVPAFIQSGTAGPYNVSGGAQISVTIPGVNAGNPVVVTFQAGDIVILGGVSVLTASHAADRINSTLAGVGVTFPVASNLNGFLRLESASGSSPLTGDTASITIKDVTAGTLANLGFGFTSLVTASGSTGPKRGIITTAGDGLGGYMPLRVSDGSPLVTTVSELIHLGGGILTPDVTPGSKIYARITHSGTSYTLTYKSAVLTPGLLTTHSGNLTALGALDLFTVTINDSTLPAPYNAFSFPLTFAVPPNTAADVVSAFNAAYQGATNGMSPLEGAQCAAVVARTRGPYAFSPAGESFIITVDGGAPVTVNLAGTLTGTVVEGVIQTLLGATANVRLSAATGPALSIYTASAAGPSSSILIAPGTGGDMRALDKLGIAPGLYVGGAIAALYGTDEVIFSYPSKNPSATIAITSTLASMAKLGFSTTTVTTFVGTTETTVTGPNVSAETLIPEVLEFGEIPPGQGGVLQRFYAPSRPLAPVAADGNKNAGLSPVLGPDGKLDPAFINKIFDNVNLDRIFLGGSLTSTQADHVSARIVPAFNSATGGDFMLLLDMPDQATAARIRIYARSGPVLGGIKAQSIVITTNAAILSPAFTTWVKDVINTEASYVQFGPSGRMHRKYVRSSDPTTFADTAWIDVVQEDPSGSSGGATAILNIGDGGTAELTRGDNLIPRISTKGIGDGTSFTLIWQSVNPTLPGFRLYVQPAFPNGPMFLTVNASWTGSAWSKDVAGASASAFVMDGEHSYLLYRLATNNASWTTSTFTATGPSGLITVSTWDQTPVFFSGTAQTAVFPGTLTLGAQLPLTNVGRATPRIIVPHDASASTLRTLVATFPGGSNANTYVYRGVGFVGASGLGPGAGVDCLIFSQNCHWDGTQWVKDQTYNNASLFIHSGSGIQQFFKGGNAQLTWADSAWSMNLEGTRLGLRVPYTEDPYNTLGTTNLMQGATIPKAWGRVTYSRSSGGALSINAYDSYNVSSFTLDSGGLIMYANLYAGFANLQYTVVVGMAEDFGTFFEPVNIFEWNNVNYFGNVQGVPSTGSQIAFSATTGGGSIANVNNNNTLISFGFIAIGRQ